MGERKLKISLPYKEDGDLAPKEEMDRFIPNENQDIICTFQMSRVSVGGHQAGAAAVCVVVDSAAAKTEVFMPG